MMPERRDPLSSHYVNAIRGYRLSRSDRILAIALFLGLLSLFVWPFVFFVIRPGEVGVLYRLFEGGTETDFVYDEGLGVKWPWDRIYRYEVRVMARDEEIHALASDALSINLSTTVLFRPDKSKVGRLHKELGPDYVERVVRPMTIEAVRDEVGKMAPHDLYRLNVRVLEQRILQQLEDGPGDLIFYDGVTIRDLRLPEVLNEAITRKLTEQQRADAYQFILLQAQREAERKRIEGVGIQTFYSIVANALSPALLTWRGIEATVELARSPNSKIVIVGSGKDQLPLILGSDIVNQPQIPPPQPVDPQRYPLPSFDNMPRLFPDPQMPPPWPDRQPQRGAGQSAPAPAAAQPQTAPQTGPQAGPQTGPQTGAPAR